MHLTDCILSLNHVECKILRNYYSYRKKDRSSFIESLGEEIWEDNL